MFPFMSLITGVNSLPKLSGKYVKQIGIMSIRGYIDWSGASLSPITVTISLEAARKACVSSLSVLIAGKPFSALNWILADPSVAAIVCSYSDIFVPTQRRSKRRLATNLQMKVRKWLVFEHEYRVFILSRGPADVEYYYFCIFVFSLFNCRRYRTTFSAAAAIMESEIQVEY